MLQTSTDNLWVIVDVKQWNDDDSLITTLPDVLYTSNVFANETRTHKQIVISLPDMLQRIKRDSFTKMCQGNGY